MPNLIVRDIVLRDIEPTLLDRVRRLADARGSGVEQMLLGLLQQGLARAEAAQATFDGLDAQALQEAIVALERVPSDPGFALIGRATAVLPAASDAPNQTIAASWNLQ